MQDLDSVESDAEAPCKYFQIQACGPNGIADADGGFAKRLYEICSKFAAKKTANSPVGFMIWPGDLARSKWSPGEISLSGGDDYLVPFGSQAPYKEAPYKKVPLADSSDSEEKPFGYSNAYEETKQFKNPIYL